MSICAVLSYSGAPVLVLALSHCRRGWLRPCIWLEIEKWHQGLLLGVSLSLESLSGTGPSCRGSPGGETMCQGRTQWWGIWFPSEIFPSRPILKASLRVRPSNPGWNSKPGVFGLWSQATVTYGLWVSRPEFLKSWAPHPGRKLPERHTDKSPTLESWAWAYMS